MQKYIFFSTKLQINKFTLNIYRNKDKKTSKEIT